MYIESNKKSNIKELADKLYELNLITEERLKLYLQSIEESSIYKNI